MEIKEQLDRIEREAKAAAEAGAKAAELKAAEMIKAAGDSFNAKLQEQEEKHKSELGSLIGKMDEKDKAVEEALTKMNRLKDAERESRVKTIQGSIYEALEKSEERIKSYSLNKTPIDISVGDAFSTKAVGVMAVGAGIVTPDYQPAIGIPHVTEHLRQAIPVSPTTSNLIKYIQYTKKEGGIDVVAPGAAKPQLDYNITPKEAPVRKIAGWLRVHDEWLEDIVGARDFLASELPQALLDVEDAQILKGSGTGENLQGLWGIATQLTLPKGSVTTTSNAWDKIAAGLVQIRRANRAASAIWISPESYLELLINKGNTDEYTYPIMMNNAGQISVGGVPVFQHNILAAGEAIAGDFARGVRLFQRQGAVIKFSTEDASNFTSNLTTVLIEERIAMPIYFPESFVKYTLTVPAA